MCVCWCGGDTELRSVQESEELLVNVAATINNLSYYQKDSSALRDSQLTIAKCKTLSMLLCVYFFSIPCFCSLSLHLLL